MKVADLAAETSGLYCFCLPSVSVNYNFSTSSTAQASRSLSYSVYTCLYVMTVKECLMTMEVIILNLLSIQIMAYNNRLRTVMNNEK